MSVSSDEVNLLVQHYLQELGYNHSAFAFGSESKIPMNPIAKREVPPGALVYLIQKGIMYSQMEAAAENAISQPQTVFAHQLNLLRANLRQSTDIVEELCAAARRMKVLPANDQAEASTYYLNSQTSLFLEGHSAAAHVASWSPNGDFLATGSADGTAIVWKFEKRKDDSCAVYDKPMILKPQVDSDSPADITALAWSPVEPVLAIGSFTGAVTVFKDGNVINQYDAQTAPIVSLQFNNDGSKLLSGSSDGTVIVYSGDQPSNKWKLEGELMDVFWSGDKFIMAAVGSILHQLAAGEEDKAFFTAKGQIIQAAPSPDKSYITIGDETGSIVVLNNSGQVEWSSQMHVGSVCSVSWTSIKFTFASGGVDGAVKMVNFKDPHPLVFEGHATPAYSVAFDPRGRYIASTDVGNTFNVWSLETKRLAITYSAEYPITQLIWSPFGRFLTILLQSGQVSVIDFQQIC